MLLTGIISNISVNSFSELKNLIDIQERTVNQSVDITNYNQHTNHADYGDYHNTHTNTTKTQKITKFNHSNTPHTDTYAQGTYSKQGGPRAGKTGHVDEPGVYHNSPARYSQAWKHDKNGVKTTHWDRHVPKQDAQYYDKGHTNQRVNQAHQNNKIPYQYTESSYQQSGHDNSYHVDNEPHRDTGFHHTNYIPSKVKFNVQRGDVLRDISNILFYAYDKNSDGHGSQDSNSKDVRYTLTLQKIANLEGTPETSSIRTLVNKSSNTSIQLNTIDPLGVGETDFKKTEGIYKIVAYAENPTRYENGVTKTYKGATSELIFMIQQNYAPIITIENGEDFIGYSFGSNKIAEPDQDIVDYLAPNQIKGIPLRITLTDQDKTDTHTATVTIVDSQNQELITPIEILISGNDQLPDKVRRTGFTVIPKSLIDNLGEHLGSKLKITVKDYKGDTGKPTGTITVVTKEISDNSMSRNLSVDIDTIAPIITFSKPLVEYTQDSEIETTVIDNGRGLKEVSYQILKNTDEQTDNWINVPIENPSRVNFSKLITEFGTYKLVVKAKDNVGNEKVSISEIVRVAPLNGRMFILPQYPSTLPASENFTVRVEIDSDVDLHNPILKLKTPNTAPFPVNFEGTMQREKVIGNKYYFTLDVPIDKRVHDGDINFEMFVNRKDTAFDNNKPKVRYTLTGKGAIFTPIELTKANSPTIVAGRDTLYLGRTTKYVEKSEIKLYVGTPYETEWIMMDKEPQDNGTIVWGYSTKTPSHIQENQVYKIKSTLPTGKTEEIEHQVAYLKVDTIIEHTDEWLERLKGYNRWKTGNEDTPRTLEMYFSEENIVVTVDTASDKRTPITQVGIRVFKQDGTELTENIEYLKSTHKDTATKLINEKWKVNSNVLSRPRNKVVGKTQEETLIVRVYVTVGDVVEYEYQIKVNDGDGAFKGYREK